MKASEVVFDQQARTWVSCDRKGYATKMIKQLSMGLTPGLVQLRKGFRMV